MAIKKINIHDERELITFANDFFDKSDKYNRRKRQQWLLNILFIIGEQYSTINRHTGAINRVRVEDDPEWVVRTVNNRVMPIYRTMVSKLTKNKPIPMCTANSMEERDIQAARAATKLAMNHWLNLGLDEKHQEIAGWLVSCGNVFVKQFYNPNKGDTIDVRDMTDEVEQLINAEMEGPGQNQDQDLEVVKARLGQVREGGLTIGDTDLVVRSPFNCRPQPGKLSMDSMQMFGDSEFLTPEEVLDKYGVEVEPSTERDKYTFNFSIGEVINTGEIKLEERGDLVEVREIYVLPSKQFPKGIQFKWAEGVMLEKPRPCDEIPIYHCGFIRVPGTFWFQDLIADIIPMQRRWNELLSKIEMHNDIYNDPPIIVDPNVINIDDWVAKPGLIIEKMVAGGENPHVVEVPILDQSIFQEINILDKQFEIVPVLNKVSFGKDTPNARSGLAINYLQEKDDDVVRPLIAEIENFYTKVFKRDLKLCRDNYSEDRGFAVVGANNQVEWVEFSRAYLDANIDIQIEPGSAMPRSIAAQQSMVFELMDRGFFLDPKTGMMDYVRISRYMEFGGIEEMYEDLTIDSDHAKRCIDRLKAGEPIQVQEWFNVNVHLYEVDRFRKTTEYDDLPDDIKFLVDNYAMQCLAMLQSVSTPTSTPTPAPPGASSTIPGAPSASPTTPANPGIRMKEPTPGGMPAPMTDEEVRSYLSRLRRLKPDLYKQIKDMDPEQVVALLLPLIQMAQAVTEQNNPMLNPVNNQPI